MMEKMNDVYLNSLPPEEKKAIQEQMKQIFDGSIQAQDIMQQNT